MARKKLNPWVFGLMGAVSGMAKAQTDIWETERLRAAKELERNELRKMAIEDRNYAAAITERHRTEDKTLRKEERAETREWQVTDQATSLANAKALAGQQDASMERRHRESLAADKGNTTPSLILKTDAGLMNATQAEIAAGKTADGRPIPPDAEIFAEVNGKGNINAVSAGGGAGQRVVLADGSHAVIPRGEPLPVGATFYNYNTQKPALGPLKQQPAKPNTFLLDAFNVAPAPAGN